MRKEDKKEYKIQNKYLKKINFHLKKINELQSDIRKD